MSSNIQEKVVTSKYENFNGIKGFSIGSVYDDDAFINYHPPKDQESKAHKTFNKIVRDSVNGEHVQTEILPEWYEAHNRWGIKTVRAFHRLRLKDINGNNNDDLVTKLSHVGHIPLNVIRSEDNTRVFALHGYTIEKVHHDQPKQIATMNPKKYSGDVFIDTLFWNEIEASENQNIELFINDIDSIHMNQLFREKFNKDGNENIIAEYSALDFLNQYSIRKEIDGLYYVKDDFNEMITPYAKSRINQNISNDQKMTFISNKVKIKNSSPIITKWYWVE